jgi:hypothetical protein
VYVTDGGWQTLGTFDLSGSLGLFSTFARFVDRRVSCFSLGLKEAFETTEEHVRRSTPDSETKNSPRLSLGSVQVFPSTHQQLLAQTRHQITRCPQI